MTRCHVTAIIHFKKTKKLKNSNHANTLNEVNAMPNNLRNGRLSSLVYVHPLLTLTARGLIPQNGVEPNSP